MVDDSKSSSALSAGEVQEFVDRKQRILRENPDLNEEEIKAAVLTDFIRLLGWEIPIDGRMEYQFGEHNTNVVDYALLDDDGVSKVFVEAKSPGTSLASHRSQITEYLALDDVELGVLTNGEVYEIYRTHITDGDRVERQLVSEIRLPEFPENLDVLNSLTKPEVTAGTYRDRLQRVVDLQNARDTLDENRQELASDLVSTVADRIGSIVQEPARDHVSDYLDSIDAELASATGREPESIDPEAELAHVDDIEFEDGVVVDMNSGQPIFETVDLANLPGDEDAKVGVYACDFERGMPFVYEHDAWGFIRIASKPEYFCLYLNRPYQQLQVVASVSDIVSKDAFFTERDVSRDPEEIADDKMALIFDDIYQLANPIPVGEVSSRMQGLMYTSLGELRSAETTDDL